MQWILFVLRVDLEKKEIIIVFIKLVYIITLLQVVKRLILVKNIKDFIVEFSTNEKNVSHQINDVFFLFNSLVQGHNLTKYLLVCMI